MRKRWMPMPWAPFWHSEELFREHVRAPVRLWRLALVEGARGGVVAVLLMIVVAVASVR
jgi:hypothetical protein